MDEDIIGKKILGFQFTGRPTFVSNMKSFIGKEGTIEYFNPEKTACSVKFEHSRWSYPYPEILNHLVKEKTIEELLNEIKQLTTQL